MLLVEAVKSDHWMTRGNIQPKLKSEIAVRTAHGFVTWLQLRNNRGRLNTLCMISENACWGKLEWMSCWMSWIIRVEMWPIICSAKKQKTNTISVKSHFRREANMSACIIEGLHYSVCILMVAKWRLAAVCSIKRSSEWESACIVWYKNGSILNFIWSLCWLIWGVRDTWMTSSGEAQVHGDVFLLTASGVRKELRHYCWLFRLRITAA